MAGLAEKRQKMSDVRNEMDLKKLEFEKLAAELQNECTHEIVIDRGEERMCYICCFTEIWNPGGTGFDRLGNPLMILPEELAKTFVKGDLDKLLRKQERMHEFLKNYFGK